MAPSLILDAQKIIVPPKENWAIEDRAMSFTTIQPTISAQSARRGPAPSFAMRLYNFIGEKIALVRARRKLHAMDEHQYRDVGIHRTDITILTAMGRMGG